MRNILFSGNVKVFDGILTGMLSIFMRTKSTEPYRIYIFTMDVSHLREDFLPVSDEQIAFLNEVAKSYNKENIVIKIDVTDIYKEEFAGCPNEGAYVHHIPCFVCLQIRFRKSRISFFIWMQIFYLTGSRSFYMTLM